MKKFLIFTLLMVSLFSLVGCSGGDNKAPAKKEEPKNAATGGVKVIQLGFTVAAADDDPYCAFAEKFASIVAEKSKGQVKIEIYPGALLGADRELLEGVKIGTVDMTIMTNAVSSTLVPSCGLFDMPFIFKDSNEAAKILDGPIGQKILEDFTPHGIMALAWGEGGFRHLISTKKAVRTPEDMIGQKIRCMETKTYIDTYAALGVNAVPMSFSEIVPALQQGTIDGLDIPITVAYSNGFVSTVKNYYNMTGHFYSPITILMNKKVWDQLTPEQQAIFKEAAVAGGKYSRENNLKNEKPLLEKIAANGLCTVVTDVNVPAFRKNLSAFYDKQKTSIGGTYVDDLMKALSN